MPKNDNKNWKPVVYKVEGDAYPYWGGIQWKDADHFDRCYSAVSLQIATEEAQAYAKMANRNKQPKNRTSRTALPSNAKKVDLYQPDPAKAEKERLALNKLIDFCNRSAKRR